MRKFAALALVLLTAAACSSGGVHVVSSEKLNEIYARSEPQGPTRVVLFMFDGERLVTLARVGRSSRPLPELAVRALLSGPTGNEKTAGVTTSFPIRIELTGVDVVEGIARVDLNLDFASGGADALIKRCAQVVFTLTELEDVDAVQFYTDGRLLTVPDQDGQMHADAVARPRYSRFTPSDALQAPRFTAPLRIDVRGDDAEGNPEESANP